MVLHTDAGRTFSMVRRMKAEKKMGNERALRSQAFPRKVVVEIGVLNNCGRDRIRAKSIGFRQPPVPLIGREVALTNAHQRIQLLARLR